MTLLAASAALKGELARVQDSRVLMHVESMLLPNPRSSRFAWSYGEPGETFEGWMFLEHPGSASGIAYCEHGFGQRCPWVLVSTDEEVPDLGMDCGWFPRFMDAYFETAADVLDIWRVVKRKEVGVGATFLSGELSWDAAWAEVMRLRHLDPLSRYDCEHSIAY